MIINTLQQNLPSFGNYRLLHLLGQGGFADVYLAEHVYLKTKAAIKVLQTHISNAQMEHFLLEARIIAHLEHPHIVQLLEYGVEQQVPYLAMIYAPGGTLRQRHLHGTLLPLTDVVTYIQDIASALQYAHMHKITHCDIKPENILIGSKNELLLSDFGIAGIMQEASSQPQSAIAGTVTYMAPEHLQGQPCAASDQYSLGIMTYEWLCGEPPFQGSFAEIATQHALTAPPPLHEKVAAIPREVEVIVLTALAKDPHHRFASVEAFAHALALAAQLAHQESKLPLQGTSLSSSDQNLVGLQRHRLSRRAVLVGLGGIGCISLIGSLVWKRPTQTVEPPYIPQGTVFCIYHGHFSSVNSLSWSPHGTQIVSGGDDTTVQIWDTRTGRCLYNCGSGMGSVTAVRWSRDNNFIAIAEQALQIRDATDGTHLFTYSGTPISSLPTPTNADVAWSFDSKHIALAEAGIVQVRDAMHMKDVPDGGLLVSYRGHKDQINSITWSPDGKYIASASSDITIRVWEASTGRTLFIYNKHPKAVRSVAWSPDGKYIASASEDRTVHIWSVEQGTQRIYRGHTDVVCTVAWSSDSTLLASAGQDHVVQIWNARSGNHLFTYKGHTDVVRAVAWAPDGEHIASASNDTTVQIWKAI